MNPFPRDQDKQREVMYMEQVRTNELLEKLIGLVSPKQDQEPELKRQDLMKEIAKLENKPQGWNKWETEKMREYLRGKAG